jgi:tRNA dimethylallyltransferase
MKRVVVALVGCTASGKTAVGELVARGLDGEVVCADSRQVFRELDIGTGKPSAAERAARPHHLFDSLSVAAYGPAAGDAPRATAGWYARAARAACAAVHARERVPVLVGGSGLYLRAAREGLAPTPEVDPASGCRANWPCRALRRCTGGWRTATPRRRAPSTPRTRSASRARSK